MAQNNNSSKRPWGRGSVLRVRIAGGKLGYAIRWYDENGKYRYETLGDVSLRKADQELRNRQAEVEERRKTAGKPTTLFPTFSEHVERWMKEVVVPNYKHSTQLDYGNTARKVLVPRFGQHRLDEIRDIAQEVFTELAGTGRYRLNTLRGYRKVFRLLMKKAMQWHGLPTNPAEIIDLPRARTKNAKFPAPRAKPVVTMKEASDLIHAIHNPRARTIVTLAFHTGMRRGELISVRWRAFDKPAGLLHITEAVYEGVIDIPKTGPDRSDLTNSRDVDLQAGTIEVLEDWRRSSKRTAPDDFIFATRTGKMIRHQRIIQRFVHPACERLGLPKLNWNAFRRCWQTWGEIVGISPRTIADVVGHASTETQKIYIQPLKEERRKAVEQISGKLHSFHADQSQLDTPFDIEEALVN